MRTGNIYKTAYNEVIIITNVTKDYVHWISATHGNCQGGTQVLTTETEVVCDCMDNFGMPDMPDVDCPHCHGTGKMKQIKLGMDKAIYLADNMFEYIKNRMLKNFDF